MSATVPPDGLTLLVVDDEPAWVGALGAALGEAGHHLVAAHEDKEAMGRFHSNDWHLAE